MKPFAVGIGRLSALRLATLLLAAMWLLPVSSDAQRIDSSSPSLTSTIRQHDIAFAAQRKVVSTSEVRTYYRHLIGKTFLPDLPAIAFEQAGFESLFAAFATPTSAENGPARLLSANRARAPPCVLG